MRVLYLEGDPSGLKYVSGTLTRMGVVHEVVRPGCVQPQDLSKYQAVILSDFPRSALHGLDELIVRLVASSGQGLLMLGGPRSFGRGGYAGTPLAGLLPVSMLDGDDRAHLSSGMLAEPAGHHPILRGIDWSHPPLIVGHNRIHPKEQTTTVLTGHAIDATAEGIRLNPHQVPLLVVREAEGTRGRTAALSTKLAPPWCGGLPAWGERTLDVGTCEPVGMEYATFVMNLIRWVAGEETIRRPLPSWDELAELPPIETLPTLRVTDGCPAPPPAAPPCSK